MRSLILAAAMLAAAPAMADLVASNGKGNEMRLEQAPCTNEAVLSYLKPEFHSQFKRGMALLANKPVAVCWIDTEQGAYWIVTEAGEAVALPITIFVDEPGV